MSREREETDRKMARAFIDLERAVIQFRDTLQVPKDGLRGYTLKQPYAKSIRVRITSIMRILNKNFQEVIPCLEPDPKDYEENQDRGVAIHTVYTDEFQQEYPTGEGDAKSK